MSVRVYLGLRVPIVREAWAVSGIPGPLQANAVTEALREELPQAGEEELEYAALEDAALASWHSRVEGDPLRRLVVVAEVAAVEPGGGGSAVVVPGNVSWSAVVAMHLDTENISDDDLSPELAWFATQEIGLVLDELG